MTEILICLAIGVGSSLATLALVYRREVWSAIKQGWKDAHDERHLWDREWH